MNARFPHFNHALGLLFVSISGFYSAFIISWERLQLLLNPLYTPGCSINIWIDCGKVMQSTYATMFGFPNSWLGLIGWPMAWLTVIYLLMHKEINQAFIRLCMFITIPAVIISYIWTYLAFFEIGAVCPWCILSCISATIVMLVLVDLNARHQTIPLRAPRLWQWIFWFTFWILIWVGLLYIAILR